MPSVLRSVTAFALVCAFAALTIPGCSQQGEGERCDSAKNGDADCDSGLTCVKKSQLAKGVTDRCCPAEGRETDTRCTRGIPGVGTGGTSAEAAAGAGGEASSSAGSSAGGDTAIGGAPVSDGGMPGIITDGGTPGASGAGGTPDTSSDGGTPSSQGGVDQGGVGQGGA